MATMAAMWEKSFKVKATLLSFPLLLYCYDYDHIAEIAYNIELVEWSELCVLKEKINLNKTRSSGFGFQYP